MSDPLRATAEWIAGEFTTDTEEAEFQRLADAIHKALQAQVEACAKVCDVLRKDSRRHSNRWVALTQAMAAIRAMKGMP